MRISDWSSDVCSSDLIEIRKAIADRAAKPESLTEDDLHDWHILELVFRSRSETDGSLTIRGRKVEKRFSGRRGKPTGADRSEEHTSELQSLMRISYAVFCLQTNSSALLPHTHGHTTQLDARKSNPLTHNN